MKKRRNRRLGKLLGLPVLAVCGFAIAATLGERGTRRHNDDGHVDELDVDVHVDELRPRPRRPRPPRKAGRAARPGSGRTTPIRRGPASGLTPTTRLTSSRPSSPHAPADIGSKTLLAGLQQGGGDLDALTRHAIAAVLSAAHPDVDYPLTVAEIVDMVNDAYSGLADDRGY